MKLVVDASVAAKGLLAKALSTKALDLVQPGNEFVVPDLRTRAVAAEEGRMNVVSTARWATPAPRRLRSENERETVHRRARINERVATAERGP